MNQQTAHRQCLSWGLVWLCVLGVAHPAAAQTNNPNRALMQKLQVFQQRAQALEQEKSALQAEKEQAQAALKQAQRELDRLQAAARLAVSLKTDLSQQTTANDNLKLSLTTAETRLAEVQDEFRREQARWQDELQREQSNFSSATQTLQATRQQLDGQTKSLNLCQANNQALFELNTDLLSKYEAAYKASSVLRGGFLTQLDWVKVENDNGEIRDRLNGARVR